MKSLILFLAFILLVSCSAPTADTPKEISVSAEQADCVINTNVQKIIFPTRTDERNPFNNRVFEIRHFRVNITLPNGWTIRRKSANDKRFPLTGAWSSMGIYNSENECVGAIGYNTYTQYAGSEELPQSIYSEVTSNTHYNFDTQTSEHDGGAYLSVHQHETGETAVTEVITSALMAKQLGLASKNIVNHGILSYNRDLLVYIVCELDSAVVDNECVKAIAQSIQIEPV
ncbi:MAG: hypothetical protein IKV41_03805 [Oscillospiraceae bacterium]|nr:hypothetical protein [Oscillospiraceae bacterium]